MATWTAAANADSPAGQLDPLFGNKYKGQVGFAGHGYNVGPFWTDVARAATQDGDGRLLQSGWTQRDDGICLSLFRFTSDGKKDAQFGSSGRMCHGKIAAEWEFTTYQSITVSSTGEIFVSSLIANADLYSPILCRFDKNGNISTAFGDPENPGCYVAWELTTPYPRTPTQILNDESFAYLIFNNSDNEHYHASVTRIDADTGAIKPYATTEHLPIAPSETRYWIESAKLNAHGKIFAAGHVETDNNTDWLIAKFDTKTGKLDTDFNQLGTMTVDFPTIADSDDRATSVELLSDGQLLIAGSYQPTVDNSGFALLKVSEQGETSDNSLVTYDPCAISSSACNSAVRVSRATITSVKKLLLAGEIGSGGEGGYAFAARLAADGTPDPLYGSPHGLMGLSDKQMDVDTAIIQGDKVVFSGTITTKDTLLVGNPPQYIQKTHTDLVLARIGDGKIFADEFELEP